MQRLVHVPHPMHKELHSLLRVAHVALAARKPVVVVTHDPAVAAAFPRTVTIRDGRVGGEGRSGEEYAVVSADGSLPLPADVLGTLPPGTLVRVHPVDDGSWSLHPVREEES